MKQYYYKGKIYEQEKALPLIPANRAFLYGDGFFETMKYVNGTIFNEHAHISRIERSSVLLGEELAAHSLLEEIKRLLSNAFPEKDFRLRITFFRTGGGRYKPDSEAVWDWLLSFEAMDNSAFTLNEKGLHIGKYDLQQKATGKLANIKSTSAQLYVQAAKFAQEQQWDDALICNTKGNIIEATASNIFAIKSGYLFTPALSEGPVAGTMRAKLLQLAFELGLTAASGPLEEDKLLDANEIFLSNAIMGIRWVEQYKGKTFQCKHAPKVLELLT
ncbi:MAG: aminotransferase class IV [Chitinophagales bacterium]